MRSESDKEDRGRLADMVRSSGCDDFKWIEPASITVARWVRMKCQLGCSTYGKSLSCPPNTPTITECREFIKEYSRAVLLHFTIAVEQPEERFPWCAQTNRKLLAVERAIFLSGYHKAFVTLVNECLLCSECSASWEDCKHPASVRPVPESLGIDVFETARTCGFPIQVLTDYTQTMNRFALLLIE